MSKPQAIKSVTVKDQGQYGTCFAHACSRNFVRTLQILGVIKAEYNEQFYLLFLYTITERISCNTGGNYLELFEVLTYLKQNYEKIFNLVRPNHIKCYNDTCSIERNAKFLNLKEDDKREFIKKINEVKDFLHVGKYEYIIDNVNKQNNYPSEAIIWLLQMKLQPYMGCSSFKAPGADNCYKGGSHGHAVILRSWNEHKVEIKNSWGDDWATKGNYVFNNIADIGCANLPNKVIYFASLIFDYDNLPTSFKNNVDETIKLFGTHTNISYSNIKEDNNFYGKKKYGFFDYGRYKDVIYDNEVFEGYFLYGFKNKGKKIIKDNNIIIEGNWDHIGNLIHDENIHIIDDDKCYKAEFINGNISWGSNDNIMCTKYPDFKTANNQDIERRKRNDHPTVKPTITPVNPTITPVKPTELVKENNKINYSSGYFYEGEIINNKPNGYGKLVKNGSIIYEGMWKNNNRDGKGKEIYSDKSICDGEWSNNIFIKGKIIYAQSTITYEGSLTNNQRNGYGEEIYNKNTYKGMWSNNKRHGKGAQIYENGIQYEGEWKDNLQNGDGKLTLSNGSYYDGKWENHIFVNGKMKNIIDNSKIYRGEYNGTGVIEINGKCYSATSTKGNLKWDDTKEIKCDTFKNKYLKYKQKYLIKKKKL